VKRSSSIAWAGSAGRGQSPPASWWRAESSRCERSPSSARRGRARSSPPLRSRSCGSSARLGPRRPRHRRPRRLRS
jgi:hypothetical protein